MEWTPQHKFQPPVTYRAPQMKAVFNEPSPFHGVIPPAPVSWAQRLRNPPNQLAFHKASEEKKENFFSKKNKRIISDAASDVSSVAPSVADSSILEEDSPVKFAPPRFFAPAERMETGLESLFGDAFSLGKEPSLGQQDSQILLSPAASTPLPRLLAVLLLCISCITWDYASAMPPASRQHIRPISIAIPALVTSYNLYSTFNIPPNDRNLSYVALQVIELTIAAVFARLISVLSYGEEEDGITAFGLWYLMAVTVQEMWSFISCLAAPSVPIPSADPEQPVRAKPAQPRAIQEPILFSKATKAKALAHSTSTAVSAEAKPNRIEVSQRTTRSKSRDGSRGDSLGVDGLGSLSLGGW